MSARHWAIGLVLLLGLTLQSTARARLPAAPPALGLEEVLHSVERSMPLLEAAQLEQAIARGELLAAEGGFDATWKSRGALTAAGYYESFRAESLLEKPTRLWGTSVFVGWRLGTGELPVYDEKQQTLEHGEVRAGLNVPLWRNGPIDRRRAQLAKAELGAGLAELSLTERRILLRRAATQRYWTWVAAGRRLGLARGLLEQVRQRDTGLAVRVAQGDLPPIERTENLRAIEQRRAQVATAQRALEQAALELGLYLRDGRGEPAPPPSDRLPPGLPTPGGDETASGGADVALALARRPEPHRLELERRQNQIERAWAENQLAPGIDIQLAGSRDFGRSLPGRPDLNEPELEWALFIDVPLETRLMRGRVEAAAATDEQLAQQGRFVRDRIQADVLDAHSALRAARQRLHTAERELALSLELEAAERTRFEQGESHLLLLNIREQQTGEAGLRELESLLDYHRAVADLEAARADLPRERRLLGPARP